MTTKTAAGMDFIRANAPELYQRLLDLEGGSFAAGAAAPVDAVAATTTVASDNTNVADTATVVLGTKTYTFKTALTPTEGEVLIGADADASLLNLIRAINHTGTADTDYKCAATHPLVSAAASVTAHAFVVSARTKGVAGNAVATSETSTHLTVTDTVMTGGVDGTPGYFGQVLVYALQPYICLAAATIATSGAWKKLSVASL